MSDLYLGLDSSTQGLTGVVIDPAVGRVILSKTVNFDAAFPAYGTCNGVLRDADPRVVHAPPMMWVDALDKLLVQLSGLGVPLGQVKAIAGSGQQHGSVYLNARAGAALAALDPKRRLTECLDGVFSRSTSPIWMDSSTTAQCEEITRSLAARGGIVELTGSAAFERFTGPQIRKFAQQQPGAYAETAHIALVSSFLASVLTGRIAPIDHGDGAGMNLMDIRRKCWQADAVAATAPGLDGKLPPLCASWDVVGTISPYFVARHGFQAGTRCVAWSGDNPNSVIGLGLVEPGQVAISLGTSDTYFGTMRDCRVDPRGEGHVFVSPTGDYMTLICFKNGSLAREKVRDQYNLDWPGFDAAMAQMPPGNGGRLMLPYFEPEIVPKVLQPGVRRLGLAESDVAGNCRAVVEAQMISMRIHSDWMGVPPKCIYATGGASRNLSVLQVMADVFQCPVHTVEVTNSAALGAAFRAVHAATGRTWKEIATPFGASRVAAQPRPETRSVYESLLERYARAECS